MGNMIFDDKPFFNSEKFGTTQLSSIYAINQQFGGEKSQMVRLVYDSWNQLIEELKSWQQLQNECLSAFSM